MKTFRCEEIMCDHCVSRIKNGLGGSGIGHKVDLEHKTVTVEEDSQAEKAVDILDDLGFSAVEI